MDPELNTLKTRTLTALRQATDARGLRPHELAETLGLEGKARHRLRHLLALLVEEGTLEKAEGQRVRPAGWTPAKSSSPKVSGLLRVHPAGYGFVERDDGEDDVFIAARNRGPALDRDRVLLSTWMGFKGTEGRIVEVLARGRARLTGIISLAGRTAHLEPDDPRVHGPVTLVDGAGRARPGQAVVAEIVRYPSHPEEAPTARLLRVLGDPEDPSTEVAKILAIAEIPEEFPEDARQAAAAVPQALRPEDLADRIDLRDRPFVTIDPVTARDFDDAVCVEDGPRPGVDRLWVAIADVSHYVAPTSPIDREAELRGVSVYLPDRAIPMLPDELSARMCSLVPDEDRLAMVARLDVDEGGQVVGTRLAAAVIRSHARLDYDGVAAALADDLRGQRARYRPHLPQLERLVGLTRRLRALRHERGALDFDLPEAVVVLDDDDPTRVRDVRKSRSQAGVKAAYQMIEDCMLAANEAVARYFIERQLDTIWRVHDVPSDEQLFEFSLLAQSFGVPFSVEDGRDPRRLRDFLERIQGQPMERALSYLLLRAMKQAVYDVINVGHFGLASPAYLHFTSPIRRYPDLLVHRLLKRALHLEGEPAGGESARLFAPKREELARLAAVSSSHERRAMDAERETVDLYRSLFMRDRTGEEFAGTIVGVTSFALFVEIAQPFIEGAIKIESLPGDSFIFDERSLRLAGKRSGRSFSLGDAVRVRVENVSVARRRIDFALVEHREAARVAAGERRGKETRKGRGGKR